MKAPMAAHQWFRRARYGMFITYGPYSVLERRGWAIHFERIPFAEYQPLAARFIPVPGAAAEWVRLARESGMRYLVRIRRAGSGSSA